MLMRQNCRMRISVKLCMCEPVCAYMYAWSALKSSSVYGTCSRDSSCSHSVCCLFEILEAEFWLRVCPYCRDSKLFLESLPQSRAGRISVALWDMNKCEFASHWIQYCTLCTNIRLVYDKRSQANMLQRSHSWENCSCFKVFQDIIMTLTYKKSISYQMYLSNF